MATCCMFCHMWGNGYMLYVPSWMWYLI